MTGFLDRDTAERMAAEITILEASIDRTAPSPVFTEFKNHWDRVRGERWAPSWRDFDPVDFHHLWRNLVLWDVEGDVYDFRVRMAGVGAVSFSATTRPGNRSAMRTSRRRTCSISSISFTGCRPCGLVRSGSPAPCGIGKTEITSPFNV